ncbi:MAG TPA: ammonium transporter [Egibacteraceae bacterium]|nr:ammonium transporter [Egibacteraceae bacterium]
MELTLEGLENNVLILFIMLASVLVFIMHVGFTMLEAGFTRAKNSANIIAKNLMTLCLGFLVYWAVGFAIMYGASASGLFGTDGFFLLNFSEYEPLAGSIAIDFLFQGMFAATAATIVSGAVAERMKFGVYGFVAVAMTALIYPVIGHWKWGGGWLAELGFLDFAGSTVVHLTGGVAAFVGALILGPRIGKFAKDGTARAIPGHSMPLGALGVLILFFGWFGFNGGSVLALDGPVIASVLLTTAIAGAAGGVGAGYWTRLRYGKFDVGMLGNGILAGLVGITAGADVVNNLGAVLVGLLAGVVVALAVPLVDKLKVDDPVGAVSVHGVCGALGTLWVGLMHTEEGLFYGGGATLLGVQAVGVLATIAYVGVVTAVLFSVLKATVGIRVSEQEEIEGLDIHEHGMYGYPELALGPAAYPGGPATETSGPAMAPVPKTAFQTT